MSKNTILVANPGAGYMARKSEIDTAIAEVLESGWYILGKTVTAFEEAFAGYIGARYGIGVASGTDALLLAIRACGIGQGDAVVTVSHTAVATVAAIVLAGAQPVLVDIDEETFTLDPKRLENTIRRRSDLNIRAVIPVHLYGHPAEMSAIMETAEKYNLYVIEDCAQAHGAKAQGRVAGSIGHVGAYSFYPTKNLSALGDGGAIVTNDPELHDRINMLRQYGWRERYISEIAGMNSRLDELQAAVLQVKLKYIQEDNSRRRTIANQYKEKLSATSLALPKEKDGFYHVFHQYVVRSSQRDSLKNYLVQRNISTSILYPQPVHLQAGYAPLITKGTGELLVTEKVCGDLLCLPIYPELTNEEVSYVCDMILQWQQQEA
jgi:dTDP-4-amino-4,6-dideoxygalactose transaminase